jgi:ATP-binding cassette subfamily B protein
MSKKNSSITYKTIKLYWDFANKYPRFLYGMLISMPIVLLVSVFIPPLILANIFEKLSSDKFQTGLVWDNFGTSLVIYCVLMFIGSLGWRVVDAFNWRLEANVLKTISNHIYKHLMNQSANFHANNFGGSLVSQTNKFLGSYIRVTDTTVYGTLNLLFSLIFTAVILAPKVPVFVIAFIIFSIIYIISAFYITKNIRKIASKHSEAESKQTGYLSDSITNVMAIKSFSSDVYERKQFNKKSTSVANYLLRVGKAVQKQMFYYSGMSGLIQSLAVIISVIAAVNYHANIATVFLVLSYTSTIADKLFNFSSQALRAYNRAFGDAAEMTKILGIEPEVHDVEKPEFLRITRGAIEFDDVNFKHDGATKTIFNNLSFKIKPGEKIGLVGNSGSGKTSLTKVLLRFSDIQSGKITVDNQNISIITQNDLRSVIAYVPQEPLLFHRSLAENIAYSNPEASKKEIVAVAKMAHAHDFINDLPEGYNTLVGERGIKLSGGQRQRVAIARAMLKNAPILVLDEATSALDSESEGLIQDALWKLMDNKTAIVIAHRLSTIQKMDRIIVLDKGKIIEEGSHKELIHKGGKYAELWNRQSGGFMED